MTLTLDRADIQGNVLLPYGRKTFPLGQLLLFHVDGHPRGPAAERARCFLRRLLPQITTGSDYRSKRVPDQQRLPPLVALNVAFTWAGLAAFGVSQTTLAGFPVEFQEGMRARAAMLNDDPAGWDGVWREQGDQDRIDLLILLRANFARALARVYRQKGIPEAQRRHAADYHPPVIFEQARQLARGHLDRRSRLLRKAAEAIGLRLLVGHGPPGDPQAAGRGWQPFESLPRRRDEDDVLGQRDTGGDPGDQGDDLRYGEYEHFGFFDGIGDPVFEGQYGPDQQAKQVIGQGRLEQGRWQSLATGEFLLGHPDEARELPAAAVPVSFSRNGTFLVVRKLHQHVARFERAIAQQLPAFQAWLDPQQPEEQDGGRRQAARQLLRAKLLGRWEDGTPLVLAPDYGQWQAFRAEHRRLLVASRPAADGHRDETAYQELRQLRQRLRDLRYEPDDHDGGRCPFTAHIRRSNPRDSGDPRLSDQPSASERQGAGSVLVNRRRILRRGLPYGPPWQPRQDARDPIEACVDDGLERGTLFMALCSGLSRQFEFLQQQWLNYGGDFGAGNDVCPISGVMAAADDAQGSKLIIGTPPESTRPPFVLRPAAAVECRGGAYFFVPSLTALRQIAQGLVDPI